MSIRIRKDLHLKRQNFFLDIRFRREQRLCCRVAADYLREFFHFICAARFPDI